MLCRENRKRPSNQFLLEFDNIIQPQLLILRLQFVITVGEYQQLITAAQLRTALWNKVIAITTNHHHKRIIGQRNAAQRIARREHLIIHLNLRKCRLHSILCGITKRTLTLGICHTEGVCRTADGGTLYYK